jgi:hypothetical protein
MSDKERQLMFPPRTRSPSVSGGKNERLCAGGVPPGCICEFVSFAMQPHQNLVGDATTCCVVTLQPFHDTCQRC